MDHWLRGFTPVEAGDIPGPVDLKNCQAVGLGKKPRWSLTVNTNFAKKTMPCNSLKWSLEIVPFIFIIYLSYIYHIFIIYYSCHHILPWNCHLRMSIAPSCSKQHRYGSNSPFSSMMYHDVPIGVIGIPYVDLVGNSMYHEFGEIE